MEIIQILLGFVILFVVAMLLGELFKKMKQPPLGGQLLAGIILGPTLFGIVQPDSVFDVFSTIAIFFVMLFIGLEMNLKEIRKTGISGLVISVTSLIIPFFVGFQISVFFGLGIVVSLFIGLLLSVTSVPVSAIILRDLRILKTKIGTTVMSAAVIDDIISLVILAIILQIHSSKNMSLNFGELGISIILMSIFLIGVAILALVVYRFNSWVPQKLENYFQNTKSRKIVFGTFIIFAIALSWIADSVGLHFILGAFFAGLIFSKKLQENTQEDIAYKVLSKISFGFFTPLFFAIIGMKLSAQALENSLPLLAFLIGFGIIGKTFGGYVGTKLCKISNIHGLSIATLLNGRGTVGLAITALAYSIGILDIMLFSICVTICFITTIVTPIMAKPLLKRINST